MSTWKMPPIPGGLTEHRRRSDPDSIGFYLDGELIWVPVALLTEVSEQPDPGYYTAIDSGGATVLAERHGEDWYLAGQIGSVPWGAVRDNYSTFTRLVPAPPVVKLPWSTTDVDGARCHIDSATGSRFAATILVDDDIVGLTAQECREAGNALLTAADEADRRVSDER